MVQMPYGFAFSSTRHITVWPGNTGPWSSNDLGIPPRRGSKVKAIKLIGLAVLTALLAMAFVGATSAMAESTALCSADESPCAKANLIKHIHEESVGKAKLLSSVGTTECNVLFLGMVLLEGNPLTTYGTLTLTNCGLGGSSCTATEENGPGEIRVLKEGHETAKVTYEYLVHLTCSGFIDCSYNGVGLVGTAKGPLLSAQTPDNGEVSLSEQTTNKETGGFLCPKTAKLDIVTSPLRATYISAPPAMECISVTNGWYLSKVNSTECGGKDGSLSLLGTFELIGAP
jgi:hypothetical protein